MPVDSSSFLRDPVSSGSHLLWCLLGFFVTVGLWWQARGDRTRQWSVACFGATMTILYAASGIYHGIPAQHKQLVDFMRHVDHSAIYLLIAGTATPVFVILLEGRFRVWMLCLMWSCAVVGIACKWLVPWPPHWLNVTLYVAMGWLGLIPTYEMVRKIGLQAVSFAFLGGVLYTLGALCDVVRWPVVYSGLVGPHEMLHLFDMAATVVHIYFISHFVLPFRSKSI